MSFPPLVSVIIPCYNYGRFLGEALDSILYQTYQHWECIIVDDGSKDNTKDVAHLYVQKDKRFKYIYQENSGQWSARNNAIKHSSGKYLQYLDADDMLQSEKLLLQINFLEENDHIDVIYGDVLKFDNNEKPYKFTLFHQPGEFPKTGKGQDIIDALKYDNFFLPGCVIMRRKAIDKLKEGFRKAYGLEDWDFWYRLATANCEFYHDDRKGTMLLRRHHGSNVSSSGPKMMLDRLHVRREILKDFERLNKEQKLNLPSAFISKTIIEHKRILAVDKVIYHFVYSNIIGGFSGIISHAYYSRRPFFAIYNAAHFLKVRFKKTSPWF